MAHEWNAFLDTLPGDGVPQNLPSVPKRVYARTEGLEVDLKQQAAWLRLDCVDADWFDSPTSAALEGDAYFQRMPLVAVELDLAGVPRSRLGVLGGIPWQSPDAEDELTGDHAPWFELEFDARLGFDCEVYMNLRAPPRIKSVVARAPAPSAVAGLKKKLDLAHYFPEASRSDIQTALGITAPIDAIVVYDVGQGSANGFVDTHCRPLIYADFGGGITHNRHTYPSVPLNFCDCTKAPVVLSHWDQDHWSSAGLAPNRWIRTHTWVAPLQSGVGPSHLSMAQALNRLGTLHLWGSSVTGSISAGSLLLERCTGRGRNHSGIAIIVDGPPASRPVLLPGDARYTAVPSHTKSFDSLVVPHHGADMKHRYTPGSLHSPFSRSVYSYGPGNSFASGATQISHPALVTRQDHDGNRWFDSLVSVNRPVQARQTEDRDPVRGLGHVYVAWSVATTLPKTTCGPSCSCDLSPAQM